jgi:hypothetical protein
MNQEADENIDTQNSPSATRKQGNRRASLSQHKPQTTVKYIWIGEITVEPPSQTFPPHNCSQIFDTNVKCWAATQNFSRMQRFSPSLRSPHLPSRCRHICITNVRNTGRLFDVCCCKGLVSFAVGGKFFVESSSLQRYHLQIDGTHPS